MWRISWAMIALAVFFGEAGNAQDAKCGEDCIARQGDTVYGVATQIQGPGLHRLLLVNALSAKYGGIGGVIEEGTVMSVPCAGAEGFDLPAEFWSSVAYKPMEITVHVKELPGDKTTDAFGAVALFSALLEGAMQESLFEARYQQLAAADAKTLRPFPQDLGAGGISYPWFGSDCAGNSVTPRPNSTLCAHAYWSDPLFDITSGIYSLESVDKVAVDLQTGRFCIAHESRAAVAASGVIDAGLIDAAAAGTALQCADMLAARTVTVAILPDVAAAVINRSTGNGRRIGRVLDLTFSDMVHAVVDKSNPNAKRILKRFNEGVAAIRVSGEWYQIVVSQLRDRYLN